MSGLKGPSRAQRRNVAYADTSKIQHDALSRGFNTLIACPECCAAVGDRCVTSNGVQASRPHRSRRRLAIRKWHEKGAPVSAAQTRQSVPCPACGAQVDEPCRTYSRTTNGTRRTQDYAHKARREALPQ